jgi:hypothetical protein
MKSKHWHGTRAHYDATQNAVIETAAYKNEYRKITD